MSKDWFEKVKDKWDYAYESGKDSSYLSIEDIEGLLDRAELSYRLESEIDTLSMAHDEMHRLIGKDKHSLIKNLIARNREVRKLRNVIRQDSDKIQELEARIFKLNNFTNEMNASGLQLKQQNKRYREALEKVRQNMIGHYGLGGERDTYVRWSKELIDRTLEGEKIE